MGMLQDLCQPLCNASLTDGQVSYPLRLKLLVRSSVHAQGSATALRPALVAAHQVLWQVWNIGTYWYYWSATLSPRQLTVDTTPVYCGLSVLVAVSNNDYNFLKI